MCWDVEGGFTLGRDSGWYLLAAQRMVARRACSAPHCPRWPRRVPNCDEESWGGEARVERTDCSQVHCTQPGCAKRQKQQLQLRRRHSHGH